MTVKASPPLVYDLDLLHWKEMLALWGEPSYRADQIWEGLYVHLWNQPDHWTNLPHSLRERLASEVRFSNLTPAQTLISRDRKTIKTLFALKDGHAIEAVYMRYYRRRTLCISTQAGCAMGCVFCATGQMGFKCNLSSGEIVEQVLYYARQLRQDQEKVSNIVIMGMGEPFHNYDATLAAIDRLNQPLGFNLGARHFTISTVGLVPMIRKFADEKRQVNLAISLHAADDELRSRLLPIAQTYPLEQLMEACSAYVEKTKRRLSFEWALIEGVNDSIDQAQKLVRLLKGLLCHVNLIQLNPTKKYTGRSSNDERAKTFCQILTAAGIPCTIRLRRGIDIKAGCGQLASEL